MAQWKNFTPEQSIVLIHEFPQLGEVTGAMRCPSCGRKTVHWYSYPNTIRARTLFVYAWCSACHHFYSQTVMNPDWNLTDPLEELNDDDRITLESDIGHFFSVLDGLWDSGELPQRTVQQS